MRTGMVAALPLFAACMWLNDPDAIASRDAGPDADAGDAGDGGPKCAPTETQCEDGLDNDCDGLVDCIDFDCASQASCCDVGARTDYRWEGGVPADWVGVPTGSLLPRAQGGRIAWSPGEQGAIRLARCEPLAVGWTVSTDVRIESGSACPTCFAAVVLSPSDDRPVDGRLVDDLAVTVDGSGQVNVTQAGEALAMSDTPLLGAGQTLAIDVAVTPGADPMGNAVLFAEVATENRSTGTRQTILPSRPFLLQRDLLRDPEGCDVGISGLFLGLEGEGADVSTGAVTVREARCVNPSQFSRPDPPEDRVLLSQEATPAPGEVSLEMGDWTRGGMAAPALVGSDGITGTRWDVFVDATDADRRLETVRPLGFSIGHASSPETWAEWNAGAPANGVPPRVGWCHPSCLDAPPAACADCGGMLCAASCSVAMAPHWREPAAVVSRDASGAFAGFAFAAARENPSIPGRFDILLSRSVSADPTNLFLPSQLTIEPPVDCDALRDPALVAVGPTDANGFFVFATCTRLGNPAKIVAFHVSSAFQPSPPLGDVLDRVALGAFAAGGVSAPEVVAASVATPNGFRTVFRLWFLARSQDSVDAFVGLAQAQLDADATWTAAVPDFEPYPANPVLTSPSVPGNECADCELLGFAAARSASAQQTLRFLLARRVKIGGAVRYELVPLNQFWRVDFTP